MQTKRELIEALKPFAREAADYDPDRNDGHQFPDHERIEMESRITVGDLRRARAAIARAKGLPS